MADSGVVPYVRFRSKLPNWLRWPLHYSDLERCFVHRTTRPLYLPVTFHWFWMQRFGGNQQRDFPAHGGSYELLRLAFEVERRVRFGEVDAPWQTEPSPLVVDISVNPIRHTVARDATLTRERLRTLLCHEIDQLAARGMFSRTWELRIKLLAAPYRLECTRQLWTGLRPEEPTRTVTELAEEDAPQHDSDG